MNCLILSDIHGNLPALEKVLSVEFGNYDLIVSLGDIINYGPWSNECVELLSSFNNTVFVKGNHEIFFIEKKCFSKSPVCKAAFDYILPHFVHTDIIAAYKENYHLANYNCAHTINDQYIYADSEIEFFENYFIGHSHRQFLLTTNNYKLYNVGSVGQNRTNIQQVNYAVYDTVNDIINLKTADYNIKMLLSEFEAQKFPKVVIDYYKSKKP